ncbi:RICIN domain-containing protein [Actinoplanes sp. NPDC051343]|uniref:RICIN domain-containing protein n=1 Tax=Actinoplanes sp. NPDC051343 TaxID=3363906 RepID=UPI003789E053
MLYATFLGWPGSTATISTLSSGRIDLSTLTTVQLLGSDAGAYTDPPAHTQDGGGLHVTLPSAAPHSAPAYVLRLAFSGTIPQLDSGNAGVPTGWARVTNVATGLVLDGGGNVGSGSQLKQWNYDGSTNLQWQFVSLGSGWYRITNRTNGLVADSGGNAANGALATEASWNAGNNQQWRLNDMGNGRYQVVNRGTGTALDSGGVTTVGAPVKLWAPDSSANLQWTISVA